MFGFPARRYRNEQEAPITVSTLGHPPKIEPTSSLMCKWPFSTLSQWWTGVVLLHSKEPDWPAWVRRLSVVPAIDWVVGPRGWLLNPDLQSAKAAWNLVAV